MTLPRKLILEIIEEFKGLRLHEGEIKLAYTSFWGLRTLSTQI